MVALGTVDTVEVDSGTVEAASLKATEGSVMVEVDSGMVEVATEEADSDMAKVALARATEVSGTV